MPDRILGLIHENANGSLYYPTRDYCTAFAALGYRAEVLDLRQQAAYALLQRYLQTGEVLFSFALQGVGSRLETTSGDTLWSAYRTPFIGLHFDHPCHNFYNHFNDSPYVANLYHFKSFYDAQKRYAQHRQVTGLLPFEFFAGALSYPYRFKDRPIKLLYLKSGGGLAEYRAMVARLPPKLRDGVLQQLERTRTHPDLSLPALIEEAFQAAGFDAVAYRKEFWGVIECVDNYIRRERAIAFVEWLKCQDGAVIIGDGWDFIDKTNARALFRPALSAAVAYPLYAQAQFSCNTNPYGPDIIHERTVSGLIHQACSISDSNAWWSAQFAAVDALTLFRWDAPLADQLGPVIADLGAAEAAVETGRGRDRMLATVTGRGGIGRIIGYADTVRRFAASAPSMQSR